MTRSAGQSADRGAVLPAPRLPAAARPGRPRNPGRRLRPSQVPVPRQPGSPASAAVASTRDGMPGSQETGSPLDLAQHQGAASARTADPEVRKESAHAWVSATLRHPEPDIPGLVSVLEEAERAFNVRVSAKFEADGSMSITYRASPPLEGRIVNVFYPVGNMASDWVFGLGAVPVSYLSRWWRWGTQAKWEMSKPRYGPLTGAGFGTFMEADPINPTWQGSETSRDEENTTFLTLKKRVNDSGYPYWVRGHLLHSNWGPGDDWHNLTPLSNASNASADEGMSIAVEDDIKERVADGQVIGYRVQPVYGRSVFQWPKYISNLLGYGLARELGDVLAAEENVPTGVYLRWWRYEAGLSGYLGSWKYVKQFNNPHADKYTIKAADGTLTDYGDFDSVYNSINYLGRASVNFALLQLLLPRIPDIAGLVIPSAGEDPYLRVASGLLMAFATYSGLPPARLLYDYDYNLALLATAIASLYTAGHIQWPTAVVSGKWYEKQKSRSKSKSKSKSK
jgi:hypothetical protein